MIKTSFMKQFFTCSISIIAFLFNIQSASAQAPRFEIYQVMETGAALYLPGEPTFEVSYTDDSSAMYSCDVEAGDADYGAIIVDLKENLGDLSSDWEEVLVSYMEY